MYAKTPLLSHKDDLPSTCRNHSEGIRCSINLVGVRTCKEAWPGLLSKYQTAKPFFEAYLGKRLPSINPHKKQRGIKAIKKALDKVDLKIARKRAEILLQLIISTRRN